jgi:hypothetical protein
MKTIIYKLIFYYSNIPVNFGQKNNSFIKMMAGQGCYIFHGT